MKKIFLLVLFIPNFILAQSFVPNAPELDLKSYILIEPNTNTVIAEFNSGELIEPASMTKVMTGYVVADQIQNGLISLDDQVLVSEKAWKMEGSKMFIEAGKKVSILELLKAPFTSIFFWYPNLNRGKISIKPNKYLKKAACMEGRSLLKYFTLTITATKHTPVKSIKKILLR